MTTENNRPKGLAMALAAAIFWGVSGTCAQYLFQHRGVNTEWLASTRLLTAGFLLLCIAQAGQRQPVWEIWKRRSDAVSLLLFSVFGMLAVQYTYFATIQQANAATATVLQYLGPVVIVGWLAFQQRKLPTRVEVLAIVFALTGTFLLVTHGSLQRLSISPSALFWGIASAFALAFYTLQPLVLLQKWKASLVIGWGMLVGGTAFSVVHPPWNVTGQWDTTALVMLGFIILFGSLLAFYLFLSSVKIVGATDASLVACAEPLSAAVLAVVWLKVPFGPMDWAGTALIIITILLLSRKEKEASS